MTPVVHERFPDRMMRGLILWLTVCVCHLSGSLTLLTVAGPDESNAVYPSTPYRGWYEPPWIMEEPELYPRVNLHVSTTAKAKQAPGLNRRGIAALRWSWGPQSPHSNNDPGYFYDRVNPEKWGGEDYRYAGFGIDEWKPNQPEETRRAAAEGYRRARREFPGVFIAAWVTEPGKLFIELVQDGTFDLAMIEGYHWWAGKPGVGIGYNGVLSRLQKMENAGVLNRTVAGWGHVAIPDGEGKGMSKTQIKKRVLETRSRFPAMPGVIFMGTDQVDTQRTREIIKYANQLAAKAYPDPPENTSTHKLTASRYGIHPEKKNDASGISSSTLLSAEYRDRLVWMTFDPKTLSEPDDLVSATLTLEATRVENDDRQVLKVYPVHQDSSSETGAEVKAFAASLSGGNSHVPVDARIFYEAGKMKFNVTGALRSAARENTTLVGFVIRPEPTGYRPPEKPDWRFELAHSGSPDPESLPRLELEVVEEKDR